MEELILHRCDKTLPAKNQQSTSTAQAEAPSLTTAATIEKREDEERCLSEASAKDPVHATTAPSLDIKKEIAFSILNVGEMIAKTIDYYSLTSTSEPHSDELNELIKLSDEQAAFEKKLSESQRKPSDEIPLPAEHLLHVSVANVNSDNEEDKAGKIYLKKI